MKRKIFHGKLGRGFPGARLALCAIVVGAVTLWRPTGARAVGMVSHKDVVDMAVRMLPTPLDLTTLLMTYPDAVASGSMLPDWGYAINVLKDDDQPWTGYSEVAHEHTDCFGGNRETHRSYRDAFAYYLLSHLSSPYTEDDLKSIAFLFGLISHVETDETFDRDFMPVAQAEDATDILWWHSEPSHSQVDATVDVQVKNQKGWTKPEWFFPLEAIAAAYSDVGCKELDEDMMDWALNTEFTPKIDAAIDHEWLLAIGSLKNWTRENYQTAPGGMNDLYGATARAWKWTWDHLIAIEAKSVTISGPTRVGPGRYTFTAAFEPTYAIPPRGWVWDNGDTTATSTRVLAEGIYTLGVEAKGLANSTLATASVTIAIGPAGPLLCDGPNLLVNGSFEQSHLISGVAESWTAFNNGEGAQYEYRADSWKPVVSDGTRSQLIEINSIGLHPAATNRIAGLYQKVRLCRDCFYKLSFDAMMRERDDHSMEDPYRIMVGWGYSRNGGTDLATADRTEWLPLHTIYPMFEPGSMWPFQTSFVAPSEEVTVWIYAVKKWASEEQVLNVNLDNAELRLCRPVTTGQE